MSEPKIYGTEGDNPEERPSVAEIDTKGPEKSPAELAAEILPKITERAGRALSVGEERMRTVVQDAGLPPEEIAGAEVTTQINPKLEEVRGGIRTVTEDTIGKIEEAVGDLPERWLSSEADYLAGNKASAELAVRYEDERTSAKYVLKQIEEFGAERGIGAAPNLVGLKFDAESRRTILETVETDLSTFFLNKERGSYNQKKHESVRQETLRYIDLVAQAQQEGDIPAELGATEVLSMVRENIGALALQDRVASESLLGDHGVRHLVDHNISMTEKIMDQLAAHGQKVPAIDRLMLHQVMIDHDLGYAMDPVREGIRDGKFGVDTGHNLLAAKFIRERTIGASENDPLTKIFSPEQINRIHQGILRHDSSSVEFRTDNSELSREANMESAIHLADNTHAFEDKLPEVLYGVPESLETMRLLKIAGETDDTALSEKLKERLVAQIEASEAFSTDDKIALGQAARSLQPSSYRFSVPRICGNKPEISIESSGHVVISIQESSIHREVSGLFAQKELAQFAKFVKDLGGPKEIDPAASEINAGSLTVRLEKSGAETTDYQSRLNALIENPEFREMIQEDDALMSKQSLFEGILAGNNEGDIAAAIATLPPETGVSDAERLQALVEEIKTKRRVGLVKYLDSKP